MKKQKFLRTGYRRHSKLGLRRKNKLKYRKGKGLDNKMRLKMKGHLRNVDSGFRSEKKTRDLINEMKPVKIFNLEDLKAIKKGEIGIVAKVGDKNKKEIADYALKNKIKLVNLDPKKFLEKIEEKIKKAKEKKQKREEKRKKRDKKAKEKAEKEKKKQESEKAKEEKEEKKSEKGEKEKTKIEKKSEAKKNENKEIEK